MPAKDEIRLENPTLHCVLAVDYEDNAQRITILNFCGSSFGNGGYLYMHYDYILNKKRAFDFWRNVEVDKSMRSVS